MCLSLTKDSARLKRNLRRRKKPIIAYKIVNNNWTSGYHSFKWKVGINESNRADTKLTADEIKSCTVNKGFHLALDEPEKCRYPHPYPCPYPCLCPCPYPCLCPCPCPYPYNKVLRCTIDPGDIVAVGKCESITSIVATKVIVIEEI